MPLPSSDDLLALEVDDERTDDNRHTRDSAEMGIFAGQHDPAQDSSQHGVNQTAHIDVADLRPLGAQGHEPETEREDRDEDQHPETPVESRGLGPERCESFGGDTHAVDQQTAEEHLHGIQEDRIDLALVLRDRDRGVALKDNARQQQHDAPDAAPVERRAVAARADDQQQSRETNHETHDLVAVQPVVAGQQMRQQHVNQRREAHDDRADGPADEVHAEIKGRVAQEHVNQDEVAEQPLVTHDLAPHTAVPCVGEEYDADDGETQSGEIHRRKVVAEPLFDERIDNSPQHRGQYRIENTLLFHNA